MTNRSTLAKSPLLLGGQVSAVLLMSQTLPSFGAEDISIKVTAASLGFSAIAGLVLLAIVFLLFCSVLILACFDDGRRLLVRLFYLLRRMFGVEVGMRGLIQLGMYSALPALLVSFQQSFRQSQFDWQLFLTVFFVFTFVNILLNLINQSMQFKRILSPGAGRVWRAKRKAASAAIIQKINRHVAHTTATVPEVKTILKDLLDLIVLHVRDHQGNFREDKPRVFANLLIEKGADLIVIARDSNSYLPQYQRPLGATYPKEALVCGRAMAAKKVVSLGNLVHSYPEGPRTKPYKSILAIPLFGANGDTPYGALSIDCTELYFFDSFTPGKVENDLENSLQPYTQLVTLTLEALVSTDPSVMITKLT